MIDLLPCWQDRIDSYTAKAAPDVSSKNLIVKKSAQFYAERITLVQSEGEAKSMLDFVEQRAVSNIGIDTGFGYSRSGVPINSKIILNDPRSIKPLLMSLAIVEFCEENRAYQIYPFVVDLRKHQVLPFLQMIFRQSVPFVGHFLKVDLFCCFQLEIEPPTEIWDTHVFERFLQLGKYHNRYKVKDKNDTVDNIIAREEKEEQEAFILSLLNTCQRYAVEYQMACSEDRLQKSFLIHQEDDQFSKEQINYAVNDAIAAAKLYLLQIDKAVDIAGLRHLITVEMPWVITNSQMEWNGVKVDPDKREHVIREIERSTPKLEQYLQDRGLENSNSHTQLYNYFNRQGLLEYFRDGKAYCFDKKNLKQLAHLHPAIEVVRNLRRMKDIASEKIMDKKFIGTDGRFHPAYKQLGTDTGRQTSRWPNILGIDSLLRNLIIPEKGYGIGEVDWCQMEVGIAGAVYKNDAMISMFNSGDVYSAMAQKYYHNELAPCDRSISGSEFKAKHPDKRKMMKFATLGIIYGIQPYGLSHLLDIDKVQARLLQQKFMTMFPGLVEEQKKTIQLSTIRGFASAVNNVKRYRGRSDIANQWERNWMTNHPVQGSAAVIFKHAGNILHQKFSAFGARLIIPLHDSFIFEAPLEHLETVANIAGDVMVASMKPFFPCLEPRVEVNISEPGCWNKDGNLNAFDDWLNELIFFVSTS